MLYMRIHNYEQIAFKAPAKRLSVRRVCLELIKAACLTNKQWAISNKSLLLRREIF